MKKLKSLLCILITLIFLSSLVVFDVYRWDVFKTETGSEISYLKWKLLIDNK